MARAHARRRTGRQHFSKAHAGQARSAPRKRLRQRQNRLTRKNSAQTRQNKVVPTIIIYGFDSLSDVFNEKTVRIDPHYAKYHGTEYPRMLDYLRVNADLNKVSFERSVVSKLLTMGFQLEALEIEFDEDSRERAAWGRCVWYKDHPSYAEPVNEMFRRLDPSLLHAMFKTQNAGDQRFGVYSLQMIGNAMMGQPQILLHKTIVFRKVVLSPPPQKVAKAA